MTYTLYLQNLKKKTSIQNWHRLTDWLAEYCPEMKTAHLSVHQLERVLDGGVFQCDGWLLLLLAKQEDLGHDGCGCHHHHPHNHRQTLMKHTKTTVKCSSNDLYCMPLPITTTTVMADLDRNGKKTLLDVPPIPPPPPHPSTPAPQVSNKDLGLDNQRN